MSPTGHTQGVKDEGCTLINHTPLKLWLSVFVIAMTFSMATGLVSAAPPITATSTSIQNGWIRGQVHVVFKGFDLPLKQVPIYLISATDDFTASYLELRGRIVPLLNRKDASTYPSSDWISASKGIIEIEKQRVALFREHTLRTVYADNQGLFVFHDVPPGGYLVFIEGTIKAQMVIWEAAISLRQGEDVKLDFGSHNAGDTRAVYSWPGNHN